MTEYTTEFGSIDGYRKGGVQVIDDDPKNYVFSNVFEVAAKSQPWERVVVAQELRIRDRSRRAPRARRPGTRRAHDEFVLCMDGEVEVHLVKLDDPDAVVDPESEGAHRHRRAIPDGSKMGRLVLGRGHMAHAARRQRLPLSAPSAVRADVPDHRSGRRRSRAGRRSANTEATREHADGHGHERRRAAPADRQPARTADHPRLRSRSRPTTSPATSASAPAASAFRATAISRISARRRSATRCRSTPSCAR